MKETNFKIWEIGSILKFSLGIQVGFEISVSLEDEGVLLLFTFDFSSLFQWSGKFTGILHPKDTSENWDMTWV